MIAQRLLLFQALISLTIFILNGQSQEISVWLTTTDSRNLLSKKENLNFVKGATTGSTIVEVNDSQTFQVMDGFGASLTESSAYLIAKKMTESQRKSLLEQFFDKTKGIGLNFLRQPMGASDFALEMYNYDNSCCTTKDFSIARDKKYIIPLLKRIQSINKDLLIMGTPWSPPGWMKTSGNMIMGSMKKKYYNQLASYFVKYVQDYAKEGLPINYVTIQNEPEWVTTDYPGMHMKAEEQADFIKKYLGPQFRENYITTKILIFDQTWNGTAYALKVLNDSQAIPYIEGTSFHCYSGTPDEQLKVHNPYPTKGIWLTECSSTTINDTKNAFKILFKRMLSEEVIGSVRNWARSVVKWNLALDEHFKPHTGGCTNCLGLVEIKQKNGKVTYGADYYGLGHASKFVRKGAKRIESTYSKTKGLQTVAFQNPDGTIALIAYNDKNSKIAFTVKWRGKFFSYNLPGSAAVTFIWNGPLPVGIVKL